MPLPLTTCATKRGRRICLIACAVTFLTQVGPSLAGNLIFEWVGYAIDRTMP